MNRVFRLLFRLSAGCGKLPLLAAALLVLTARLGPALMSPALTAAEAAREALSLDATLIDAVLAKRAPDLGLTLRQQLGAAIAEEARRAGYDPLLVLAIIDVESDFAEEAVSDKGARGLMQIRPSTLHFLAEKEGLRLTREEVAKDPALCVRLGIRYLRTLHNRFKDLDLALMAYNAGPGRIREAMQAGDVERFRRYPRAVRRDFRRFREGEGLGGDWALAQREPLILEATVAAPP
ncbi:MAG: lytic transglycosylase domain-containing protein [Myxococcaceae bacterium]|nr:lytic transglycosylase domain-containing protein [Myxococcaceae bacterium]